jgi:hypothetical protein
MLKAVNKHIFDVVAGFAIVFAVFYLAAITHIMPLPENALTRLNEFSSSVMDILIAYVAWLISFLP